jgi:filamentous hemagglutinin family protein
MKAITKILLLVAVMAVFIMLPMKVQAATYDVSTLEDLKTVIASVDSGDTVNITGDITLDSDLTITNSNAFTITSNSGSTIACGSYKIVIGAGADVTVGGDLAITGAALPTISVQNGGRFTLAGGTVENTADTIWICNRKRR